MGIPPKSTINLLPAHCLVAGKNVFGVSGEQVTIVWKTVCKGGTVVKHPFFSAFTFCDGGCEGAVLLPKGENLLLNGWKRRRRNNLCGLSECGAARIGHNELQLVGKSFSCQDEISSAVPHELVQLPEPLIHKL
jgi:hypothetical protein